LTVYLLLSMKIAIVTKFRDLQHTFPNSLILTHNDLITVPGHTQKSAVHEHICILRRPQSLILVKENNVRTQNSLLNAKESIRSTE
jgi:hypothetical protein